VSCAILAGGGLKTGQAIGSTNRLGEHAETRPVHFQEVAATLYHAVGVDVSKATINDPGVWTRPITFAMQLTRDASQGLFEYACHEGNLGLEHILSAARAEERR